ncbi:sarcosine oxidase subunit gamma [Pseudooceanicola sp.]|uniref:sarcosine oxidase subunit gamma n=1 Tax=Pseudooceanicola sp. TaxID=1914328 RepID=UPI0035C669E3
MADITLTPVAPATGALPVTRGAMTLSLAEPGPLTSIAPFRGQVEATSAALKATTGLSLGPGYAAAKGRAVQWIGRDLWLLSGTTAPDLPGAALTDQTDAWVTLELTGPDIAGVMARLVPLDLRDTAFPEGRAVRTEMHGMMVALARTGPENLRIMAFRSMAGTLAATIGEAMESVAAL